MDQYEKKKLKKIKAMSDSEEEEDGLFCIEKCEFLFDFVIIFN
jgi:hypothetical protein